MRNLYSVFNGLGAPLTPYIKANSIYYTVADNNAFETAGTTQSDREIIVISKNATHTNFKFSAVGRSNYWAANGDIVGDAAPEGYTYPTKRYSIGDSVRVRSSSDSSVNTNIIGVLSKGDSVYSAESTVDGSGLKWRPVKYGSGKTGFVADKFLSKSKPVAVTTTTPPEETTGESEDPEIPFGKPEGEVEVSVLDKYRTPLMLAGAALVIGGIAYYIYSNRDQRSLAMAGAPKRRRKYRR